MLVMGFNGLQLEHLVLPLVSMNQDDGDPVGAGMMTSNFSGELNVSCVSHNRSRVNNSCIRKYGNYIMLMLMVSLSLDLIINVFIPFKDYFSDKCTGIFQESHSSNAGNGILRPPVGTHCTSSCFCESGRWGSSWCWTDDIELQWGAECVDCKSLAKPGKEFLYQEI